MTAARPLPDEAGVQGAGPRLTLDGILPPSKRVKARMPQVSPGTIVRCLEVARGHTIANSLTDIEPI